MSETFSRGLVWLRRDLRCDDHAALSLALQQCAQVWLVFIFDTDILDPLLANGLQADRRVEFIHASLNELDSRLRKLGGGVLVRYGSVYSWLPKLVKALQVQAVWANRDYEPSAVARDQKISQMLLEQGCAFFLSKDQVIFEGHEVTTVNKKSFSVFTPYKNAWLRKFVPEHAAVWPVEPYLKALSAIPKELDQGIPSLSQMGFSVTNLSALSLPVGMTGAQQLLNKFEQRMVNYHVQRDYPAVRGVSYLSVHLRFGTISIRTLVRLAYQRMLNGDQGASVWLAELIWREFYFMILQQHPRLAEGVAFKPEYDQIEWEQGAVAHTYFSAWCQAQTGYPLVDAAMHQINQTGFMHNRLRMLVASFLIKDMGINWRWGEQYFAQHLNDFDFSANNGGWQWCASSGCDAQPYFRIFNPITQSEKYDPEGKFIRHYLPQLARLPNKWIHAPWLAPVDVLKTSGVQLGINYPHPIVLHEQARQLTLTRYAVVKKND